MRGNRSRDTKPELLLRRSLHALGLRFRVDARPEPSLPRRADIVFRGAHVAVFVDGCYWHGCPLHYVPSKTNAEWWRQKIEANAARDVETGDRLAECGWQVVRIWEHVPVEESTRLVLAALAQRGHGVSAQDPAPRRSVNSAQEMRRVGN